MKLGHEDFLKCIDPMELLNKIRNFRRLDIKSMTYEEVTQAISNVLSFNGEFMYITNTQIYKKGTKFFRVRELEGSKIPNENLSIESDFWNAPEKYITKYGRLNKPGESLLYTAPINPQIAINEVKLKKHSFYTLIIYEAKENIKVNTIGMEYDYEKLGIRGKQAILINDMIRPQKLMFYPLGY